MTVESREEGDVLIGYVTNKWLIDETEIDDIGQQLMALIYQGRSGRILFNFKGVERMSTAMIGQIAKLDKTCKAADVKLIFCEIAPQILKLIEMYRIKANIQPTEEQALASF